MAGQAGRLQGQDRSAVTCPSSSHARRCLIWLSCDNRRTHYTAPLARSAGTVRLAVEADGGAGVLRGAEVTLLPVIWELIAED
ncbi:hypothetical protein J6590_001848 [Homalodisca vitripennis]|nr:hypothetical protein J6590_001848 [Homalodisca vitripennis]